MEPHQRLPGMKVQFNSFIHASILQAITIILIVFILPGMKEGQIYTYPSKRWQKKRRQYLHNFMQPRFNLRKENGDGGEGPSSGALLENSSFTAGPSSGSSGGVGPIPSSTSGPMIGGAGGGGASCGNPTNIQQEQESSNKETPKPDPEITKQDWFYDELDVPGT